MFSENVDASINEIELAASAYQRYPLVMLGKELKLVLEDRNFPATDFVLLDESSVAGTLTEAAGEATTTADVVVDLALGHVLLELGQ